MTFEEAYQEAEKKFDHYYLKAPDPEVRNKVCEMMAMIMIEDEIRAHKWPNFFMGQRQ
jgi:hypothetical protein